MLGAVGQRGKLLDFCGCQDTGREDKQRPPVVRLLLLRLRVLFLLLDVRLFPVVLLLVEDRRLLEVYFLFVDLLLTIICLY